MDEINGVTGIWEKYEKGQDYLRRINLASKAERCWNFYKGDQWKGLQSGGEELPTLNIIKGTVKHKVATVAQNSMAANFTSMDGDEATAEVCDKLSKFFARCWEKGKLDSHGWNILKEACIVSDACLFYGTADVTKPQLLRSVDIMFADEQQPDIQAQKYILIAERLFVEDIKAQARENGVDELEIETITSDEDTEFQIGNKTEVKNKSGKCVSILYMYKGDDGYVHFSKATRTCVYLPDTPLVVKDAEGNVTGGLTSYPLVHFVWDTLPNSARGAGEVEFLIPNQLELNKTLARRSIAVKMGAFPKLAYDAKAISNPEALDMVGAAIEVTGGNAQDINKMISYLHPAQISSDAYQYSSDLLTQTRDLAGAGDAATGQVDPTKASGAAIIAVRDQAALPLNEQLAAYKQFVEDLALVWFNLWVAYNPDGLEITYEREGQEVAEVIPAEILTGMEVDIRIDVSPDNPWSKYAQQQTLDNLLASQHITFDEYVEALDDNGGVPKGKLTAILERRAKRAFTAAPPMMGEVSANVLP